MKNRQYSEMFALEDTYWWFKGKRAYIKQVLPKTQNNNILDIGCGTGGLTQFLTSWGTVTGLEQNDRARYYATKRGIHVVKGSANKLPFNSKSFDIVTLIDVLYHKGINEHNTLKEIYRVLKPRGTLLLMDCALPQLWSRHDTVMDARKRYLKHELEKQIVQAGFTVSKSTYIFMITLPLMYVQRLLFARKVTVRTINALPEWLNKLLYILIYFESHVIRFIHLPIGSSVLIYARK